MFRCSIAAIKRLLTDIVLVLHHKQVQNEHSLSRFVLLFLWMYFIRYTESAVWLVDGMPSDAPRVSGDLLQVKGDCRVEVNMDGPDWNRGEITSWSIKPETNLYDVRRICSQQGAQYVLKYFLHYEW